MVKQFTKEKIEEIKKQQKAKQAQANSQQIIKK